MTEPHRFSVAPMMDWTDRYCRRFHRLLTRHALLYTEMVTTGALIHGDRAQHLDFDPVEGPVALQLGGCDPDDLALGARLGAQWGYHEINLNCGCPSERVQRGAFGACLMAEPDLVARCVSAMRQAVDLPITVKHRIGLGRDESLQMVVDFVGAVSQAGCTRFIVHARNAWLEGLSPKQNREVPPLRYSALSELQRQFPHLQFILNGGLSDWDSLELWAGRCDGVMVGRAAYQSPWLLSEVDHRLFHQPPDTEGFQRLEEIVMQLRALAQAMVRRDEPIRRLARHTLGLCNGHPGARRWRQLLSDPRALQDNDPDLFIRALEMVGHGARAAPVGP